jgi:ubiquinone/menaquinone biosynthesis C-methylase UbiE
VCCRSVPDQLEMMSEILRILKDGGKFLFLEHVIEKSQGYPTPGTTEVQRGVRCFFVAHIYTGTYACAAVTVIHYTCSKGTTLVINLQATFLPLIGVRCGTESSSALCLLSRCTSRGGVTLTRFRGKGVPV